MKNIVTYLVLLLIISCSSNKEKRTMIEYPETKISQQVDDYFGTMVEDPYRWLEDDNSEETKTWVKAQNVVTNKYLSSIPYREKIRERLTKIWNYPKYNSPFRGGDKYFYFKNDGLQAQSVLYMLDDLEAEPQVLLDPNKLSEDGTVALSNYSFSKDGKLLAFGTSTSGSDWNEFFVMEVETGNKLKDHLKWIKFSGIAWKDNGFYYNIYEKPKEGEEFSGQNKNSKVFFHEVGTPQSEDVLVYEDNTHPDRSFSAETTEDEQYLIIIGFESTTGNSMHFKNLDKSDEDFIVIDEGFKHDYFLIDNYKDTGLLIRTNNGAPKYKLILVDPNNPSKENWKDILPEQKEVLNNVSIVGNKIIAHYMKDASSVAYVYELDGTAINQIEFPTLGTMSNLQGKKEDIIAFYEFTSYTLPTIIYKYDVVENKSEIYHKSEIDFNINDYVTKQIFYTSKDGTKIPMFIVHKKDIKFDGNNPTLLYGYGGFNISLTPGFSIGNLIFLENGGVYAVANLRGGGEYGEKWHLAGTKLNKQNVFDDFISAAKYLISEKYTSSEKLAIRGGSNGGLLVGACMTQQPQLFKVALPEVGVMDMLRYHKFTIGHYWASDYGSSEDSVEFHYLIKYSPLHNIKEGIAYPATLVSTADHDDRVVPAHSFKFIAELQAKHKGENPVLIRIEEKAGHGAGMPTDKIIEEYTDIWAFVFKNLGVEPIY